MNFNAFYIYFLSVFFIEVIFHTFLSVLFMFWQNVCNYLVIMVGLNYCWLQGNISIHEIGCGVSAAKHCGKPRVSAAASFYSFDATTNWGTATALLQ